MSDTSSLIEAKLAITAAEVEIEKIINRLCDKLQPGSVDIHIKHLHLHDHGPDPLALPTAHNVTVTLDITL